MQRFVRDKLLVGHRSRRVTRSLRWTGRRCRLRGAVLAARDRPARAARQDHDHHDRGHAIHRHGDPRAALL